MRAGVYERVSRLATARDRKEIARARSIEEQNKANGDECARHGWEITAQTMKVFMCRLRKAG